MFELYYSSLLLNLFLSICKFNYHKDEILIRMDLNNETLSYVKQNKLDVWKKNSEKIDILIKKSLLNQLKNYQILNKDIGNLIKKQFKKIKILSNKV